MERKLNLSLAAACLVLASAHIGETAWQKGTDDPGHDVALSTSAPHSDASVPPGPAGTSPVHLETGLAASHIQETTSVEIVRPDQDEPRVDREETQDTQVAMAKMTGAVAELALSGSSAPVDLIVAYDESALGGTVG